MLSNIITHPTTDKGELEADERTKANSKPTNGRSRTRSRLALLRSFANHPAIFWLISAGKCGINVGASGRNLYVGNYSIFIGVVCDGTITAAISAKSLPHSPPKLAAAKPSGLPREFADAHRLRLR
ncbi:hypothetical protein MA16_Dca027535 [Dendrobium catenatum]|uniref:Uncharacterized protein n=1 Tax=Dendrobium catenatum TaxID=906689 RepID=A0A2I0VEZ6_9ASPA|nr:hypothetical protein MA16_Dca027535 [Dendrobium catenatum]